MRNLISWAVKRILNLLMWTFALGGVLLAGHASASTVERTDTQSNTGQIIVASGIAGESLICTLVFEPALEEFANRNNGEFHQPNTSALDKYANIEISYLLFEYGDLQHPILVGKLWNGKDRPPASQAVIPFNSESREPLVFAVKGINEVIDPDFRLFCDVVGVEATAPRRIPVTRKFGDITLKRGVLSLESSTLGYTLYHAPTGENVDLVVGLSFAENSKPVKGLTASSDCPLVELDVVVINAITLEPYKGTNFSVVLSPGDSILRHIGISHEHPPRQSSPAVPVLVVANITPRGTLTPHCTLLPLVEATSLGMTSNLEVEWVNRFLKSNSAPKTD